MVEEKALKVENLLNYVVLAKLPIIKLVKAYEGYVVMKVIVPCHSFACFLKPSFVQRVQMILQLVHERLLLRKLLARG